MRIMLQGAGGATPFCKSKAVHARSKSLITMLAVRDAYADVGYARPPPPPSAFLAQNQNLARSVVTCSLNSSKIQSNAKTTIIHQQIPDPLL